MESGMAYEKDDLMINLKATELRLGLPGTEEETNEDHHQDQSSLSSSALKNRKRHSPEITREEKSDHDGEETAPPAKAQIVGWPPIRSYRKNSLQQMKKSEAAEISGMFVKVSMDGAPYLRKIDLRVYKNYPELLKALENMFKFTVGEYSEREGYKGSDYVPTYEDKDGDWMLVGDVPWDMFMSSCKRLRIMRESEARGLGWGV
ncbi:Auxin-responsive protein IAA4 [Morus notabilis]|uniref:Auxin-responsive protein n=1 Tax=Morus notabilis TaxID=981085 RepID=W9QZI4_9ROSA|nr:auxin-responsive protein IAA4 [Morus notabilis]EXB29840.1 Auxin-responsive protein IAA4 [Morus notabilis]